MASSSSGDGRSSATGGRSEGAQHRELVPVEVCSTSPAIASFSSVDGRPSTTGGRSEGAQHRQLVPVEVCSRSPAIASSSSGDGRPSTTGGRSDGAKHRELVPVEVYSRSPAIASSSSGDGRPSTTGGRSEREQHRELVPVEVYSTSPAMASSFSVDGRSSTTGGRSQRAQLCELGNRLPNDIHTPLVVSLSGSSLECLQRFTEAGADVKTDSPVTPLLVAAHQGLCDYIKFSLNNDADTYMPDEVLARDFILRALAFLVEGVKNFLADFHGAAIERVDPRDSGLCWIIHLFSYTRWAGDNFLSENPNSPGGLHLLSLSFSKGRGITPRLISANACSIINRIVGNRLPNDIHTPLVVSLSGSSLECLQRFIEASADVKTDSPVTSLLVAAHQGLCDYIKFLLNNDADTYMPDEVLARDFILRALAFLVEGVKNFLADFHGDAIERVDPRYSGLCSIIHLFSYTRWTEDNFLSENPNSPGALHLLSLSFSKGRGITPRLISANACSIINRIVAQSMLPMEGSRPRNSVIVSFDGSNDEFKQSYRGGIEGIRSWCYANGKRVKLPEVYGPNLEVYTTPAGGTYFLTVEYKGRHLVLSLAGRDLYFMGWRSEHGTFELKPDSQTQQYMADDSCIILDIPKNYGFLTRERKVGLTWMGPMALQQAFEILYKCRGLVSDELKQAVGIFAVHFCEAARIQDIFNDSCSSFDYEVSELDSRNKSNSYWVNNYDDMAGVAMSRADLVAKGETLPPVTIPSVKVTSEMDIFRQLRVLPRDAYKFGIFATEKRKSPIFEGALDSSGTGNRSSRSERKQKRRKEDRSDGGYPPFSLLDDWPDEFEEDGDQKKEIKDADTKISGPNDISFDDYLNHFAMVKRIIGRRTQNLIDRASIVRQPLDSYGLKNLAFSEGKMKSDGIRPKLKNLAFSAGKMKSDFATQFKLGHQASQLQRTGIFQRNIFKACSVMSRILRFL